MSRVCQLTGKRPVSGNSVSHSNRKTRRRFLPNLFKKRFFIPETGEWIVLKVSNTALRSISKHGISVYLKKQQARGFAQDVRLNTPGC
ncbi:MAG: 50S ribosomal protein L28 [Saprospiraceae bacterium]|nr:50S ribosomal protein L28 [Saprospiraceae bacterium]MCC6726538.1 50S ribosomal protein L28 [Saprospiraceae bacterium]